LVPSLLLSHQSLANHLSSMMNPTSEVSAIILALAMAEHVAINVPSHRELHSTVRAIVHIVSVAGQHLTSHLMICIRPKACRR
jgi:hypothetical protein